MKTTGMHFPPMGMTESPIGSRLGLTKLGDFSPARPTRELACVVIAFTGAIQANCPALSNKHLGDSYGQHQGM